MKNPEIKAWTKISVVELEKNEFFNIFAGGVQKENMNNVEISFTEDGILQICVTEKFASKVQVKTYKEVYSS